MRREDAEFQRIVWENRKLRETLEEIAETPITRGISPVELRLHSIVQKAKTVLDDTKIGG